MSLKAIYIISLKFAPGLKKEFTVIGENLRKYGFNVKYILSQKYSELEYFYDGMNYVSTKDGIKGMITDTLRMFSMKEIGNIISRGSPIFILFYNPHPLNPRLAYFVKRKFPGAVLSLYLHDPFKPDKSDYGWKKALYIMAAEKIQDWTVRYMDHVISPSEYSQRLFRLRHPSFNGECHLAPLLVPDTFKEQDCDRRYFSMVGGAHRATGHDTFIDLVNFVAETGKDFEFCLISSSNISGFLDKLTDQGRRKLKIIDKRVIADSEIDEIIRQSYAVFRLAKEVTQSGVIPVSYMNSTPVIATDIPGHSQHVWHKETGYLIPANPDLQTIVQAMEYVKENFDDLSAKARKAYENIWAEWNFDKYYGWMIRGLEG